MATHFGMKYTTETSILSTAGSSQCQGGKQASSLSCPASGPDTLGPYSSTHSTLNTQRPTYFAEITGNGRGRRPWASLGVGVLAARELPPQRRCAVLQILPVL